jgi:hypothetical protein
MWFNIWSIIKQGFSFADALVTLGVRDTIASLTSLLWDKSILEKAWNNKYSRAIESRRGWIAETAEVLTEVVYPNWIWTAKKYLFKYNQLAMAWLKWADNITYKNIWVSAYQDFCIKNNIPFTWDFNFDSLLGKEINWKVFDKDYIEELNIKSNRYADTTSNSLAWGSNPHTAPKAFNNFLVKTLFTLGSQQLSRYWTYKNLTISAVSRGDYLKAGKLVWGYVAITIATIATTYAIGKALYELWLSETDPAEYWDISEQLLSYRGVASATIWNLPFWSKLLSLADFDTVSVLDSTQKSIVRAIKQSKKDLSADDYWKFVTDLKDYVTPFFFKNPDKYGSAIYENYIK